MSVRQPGTPERVPLGDLTPHLHEGQRTPALAWGVLIALLPAAAWGIVAYGAPAAAVLGVATGSALATELATGLARRRFTLRDGTAALTGMLIGLSLPPGAPPWVPAAGAAFAIAVVKESFGGLGRNWMNPALAGRTFAALSWPAAAAAWRLPRLAMADAVTAATPLAIARQAVGLRPFAALAKASFPFSAVDEAVIAWLNAHVFGPLGTALPRGPVDLLLGIHPACIGEAPVLLLLAAAALLLWRRVIRWEIPLSLLGSFALLAWVFGGLPGGGRWFAGAPVFHVLSGGIVLVAFFMATDPVTSPITRTGRLFFGAGIGALTFLLRTFGSAPEGVGAAVLAANCLVPLVERRRS